MRLCQCGGASGVKGAVSQGEGQLVSDVSQSEGIRTVRMSVCRLCGCQSESVSRS